MRRRLYSDRLKDEAKAGSPDVYQYDDIPQTCRVQVRQLVRKALGKASRTYSGASKSIPNAAAEKIREIVCHEKGKDNFGFHRDAYSDLMEEFERGSTESFLDLLEVTCFSLEVIASTATFASNWRTEIEPTTAIDEINFRLRDAGVGFQYEEGMLVRVDSQFVHAEAVKPALTLLNSPGFEGPQAEFLNAHQHFRQGRSKEAISEAAKSFESTMKAICDRHKWEYPAKARATDLLKVLRREKLWPDYLDASFDQLLATLTSGLPQLRNDDAAHGQGAVPRAVPEFVAAYALHLAASKIVLMVEASNARALQP